MRLIKQWLTNTFGFTKSESNGVIVLTAIVFLVAIVPRLFTVQINKDHLLSADSISLSKWVNDVNKAMVKDQLNILKPKKTILTNLNNQLDYLSVKKIVPKNVFPAYDGMSFYL